MGTLVVQAHPVADSLNGAMLDAVVGRLQSTNRAVEVVRIGQGDVVISDQCRAATELIAIYPTWWGSPPAMLAAQLVDVIGPWIDGNQSRSTSPLRGVNQVRVITSHGSSRFFNRLQGEPGLQLWKRSVLPLCASGARLDWQALYKLDRLSSQDRTAFLDSL